MEKLNVKSIGQCKYACVSLGEIMLRLDPGACSYNAGKYSAQGCPGTGLS